MKKLSKANFTLRWVTGVLFFCFGLILFLADVVRLPDLGVIPGGVLAIAALARLVLVALPASRPLVLGGGAAETASGILETLLCVLFVAGALLYIEFFYMILAGLLAALAVVRIRQGALVRKQKTAGMAAYLFSGILLLASAAGLVLDTVWLQAGLLAELAGAAALLYGIFLFSSAFFKKEIKEEPAEGGTVASADQNAV